MIFQLSRKDRIDETISKLNSGEEVFLSLYPREIKWIESLSQYNCTKISTDALKTSRTICKIVKK